MVAVATKPKTLDAYKLVHEASLVLADVERTGMRIDVAYLDQALVDTAKKIDNLEKQLKSDKLFGQWKRMFGDKAKLGSRPQLAKLLKAEGYELPINEKTNRDKADEFVLEGIKLPFLRDYLLMEGLKKAKSTYLENIKRELVGDRVHPSINLHLVKTHRSSANDPNIQNQIIRDKLMAEIVRRCFIPSKGCVLLECDEKALEFRGAAAFWRDPIMMEFASDNSKDIHRDMGAKLFLCDAKDVNPEVRYIGKNQFVFPALYGSFYAKMAGRIWTDIDRKGIKVRDMPAKKWLKKQGITELGECDPKQRPKEETFERLVYEVEDEFLEQFSVFAEKRDEWWKQYCKRGWFDLLTGFRISGYFSKNFLLNCPIQGPCFHIVLWSMVQLHKWLRKHKFKTKIITEIHDSIMKDGPEQELEDVRHKAKEVMTKDVRKHWPWICVPLEIEAVVCRENWFKKEKLS